MVSSYEELLARLHQRLPEVEYDVYKALIDKAVLEAQMDGYTQARMISQRDPRDRRSIDLPDAEVRPGEYPCSKCRQVRPEAVMTQGADGTWLCNSENYHELIDRITARVPPDLHARWFRLLNLAITDEMAEALAHPEKEVSIRKLLGLDAVRTD